MRAFCPQKVPLPPDFRRLETIPPSLDLELGCGVGWFALKYTQANPERHLIAIERTKNKFAKLQRRLEKGKLRPSNLTAIHGDGVNWVTHLLPANSIEKIFILYPNPYPKASQKNKRWHNMPFTAFLIRVLKKNGIITLATNKPDYALEAITVYKNTWSLELVEKRQLLSLDWRTPFEKKYWLRGDPLINLVFRKNF